MSACTGVVDFHQLIMELAKSGTAVILMSSDLPELVGMSDRVLVMKEGSIVGRLEQKSGKSTKKILLKKV